MGAQVGIFVLQAIVVTVLAALFVVIPNVSTSFFTLVDMAAALYLIMYMLMFASAIVLRHTKPDVARAYRVPAISFVAGVGFVASLAAFLLGFRPPARLSGIPTSIYPYVLAAVILILGAPPLIFSRSESRPASRTRPETTRTRDAPRRHPARKAGPLRQPKAA